MLPRRKPLALTRAFKRHVERVGITNLTFHDLRHDAASQLAMAGVPIRDIAEILGHRRLEMTLQYAHLAPRHLAKTMSILDHRVEPGEPVSHHVVTGGIGVSRVLPAR